MAEERRSDGAGPSPHSSTRTVLLAGACSGLVARFVTHPLDTVKARLQVQAAVRAHAGAPLWAAGTADALAKTLRAEGPPGLYRGFSAVVAAVPLASAVYFGGYELTQRALAGGPDAPLRLNASAAYVLSGVVAQAAAGLVYTPMDVVKERMQVQALTRAGGGPRWAGSGDALRAIVRAEGLRGIFKGYWAANVAWWPWNVLYFVTYEHARDAAAAAAGSDKAALDPRVSAACATAAASLATVATNPVDVVKTRLQALPGGAGGALGVARAMFAAEGAAVFAAGMSARVLSIAPGSAISFFTFERLKRWATQAESYGNGGEAPRDVEISALVLATP